MGNCKDCLFWNKNHHKSGYADGSGECSMANYSHKDAKISLEIAIYAPGDESMMDSALMTGENFGCVLFKGKQ